MKRRVFIGAITSLALAAGMAEAQSLGDFIVGQLRAQGYEEIELSRTWLGRTRIVAQKGNQVREIIFNPRTGEILRDFWQIVRPQDASSGAGGDAGAQPSIVDPDDDDDGDYDDDYDGDDGDDDEDDESDDD